MQVFKFGGASVKDADAVKNVSEIVKQYALQNTIVVISAMGKTTNALEKLVDAWFYKKADPEKLLNEIKEYHFNIVKQLFTASDHPFYNDLENTFVELNWIIEEAPSSNYNKEYDQIVGLGEVISTKIISAYLNESGVKNKWIDARGIIQTDNNYREGNVNYELSEKLVKDQMAEIFNNFKIVVTKDLLAVPPKIS